MADVSVHDQGAGVFTVEVRDRTGTTTHTVTVPDEVPGRLRCADVATSELVAASFQFLLEREPSTSILRRFSLEQIAHYFPDYPQEIARRLAR